MKISPSEKFFAWVRMEICLLKEAMEDGVLKSCFTILFLSQGTLERPFVLFELEAASKAQKQVLLVHEQDWEEKESR